MSGFQLNQTKFESVLVNSSGVLLGDGEELLESRSTNQRTVVTMTTCNHAVL